MASRRGGTTARRSASLLVERCPARSSSLQNESAFHVSGPPRSGDVTKADSLEEIARRRPTSRQPGST
jgi:hypothetical protein